MKYDHFTMLPSRAFMPVGGRRGRLMSLFGGPDPPQPDPAVGKAQERMAALAERQQDYYENNFAPKVLDQMNQSLEITRQQANQSKEMQDYQLGLMKKYDERYQNVQIPLEDELIKQAKSYNQDTEREFMAGQAGADVEQASAIGQQNLQRGLAMRGINGGSPAAIAAMADMQSNADLAKAGAMNKTREAARQIGWTKLGEAAALGRGLPSFGASSASLAMGAGSGAVSAGQAGLGAVGTAAGISGTNTSNAINANAQVGGLALGKYNADLSAYNTAAQANAGKWQAVGQMVGTGASLAMLASDRRLKTDIEPVGKLDNGLTVYRYRYIAGGPVMIGVMADEVEKVNPEAVVKGAIDGFDAVRYDLL